MFDRSSSWLTVVRTLVAALAICCVVACAAFRPASKAIPTEAPAEGTKEAKVDRPPSVDAWSRYTRDGREHLRYGRHREAETAMVMAMGITENLPPSDVRRRTTLGNLNLLASQYRAAGRTDDFVRIQSLIATESEIVLGPDDPATATNQLMLGAALTDLGRYDEAEPALERALELRSSNASTEGPPVAEVRTELGTLYTKRGNLAAAADELERARVILEKSRGMNDLSVAQVLLPLSETYREQGRDALALSALDRAVDIFTEKKGDADGSTIGARRMLAEVYIDQGRPADAEKLYVDDLAAMEEAHSSRSLEVATSLNSLAWFYVEEGRAADAEPLATRSVEIFESRGVTGAPLAASLDTLASAHEQLDNPDLADEAFRRAVETINNDANVSPATRAEYSERYAKWLRSVNRNADADAVESGIARAPTASVDTPE